MLTRKALLVMGDLSRWTSCPGTLTQTNGNKYVVDFKNGKPNPADIAVVLRKVCEKGMLTTAGKQQPWECGSLTGGELVLLRIRANKP